VSGTRWKGKKLTHAMGHQFEPNLKCKVCSKSWFEHQDEPSPCGNWKRRVRKKKVIEEAPTVQVERTVVPE